VASHSIGERAAQSANFKSAIHFNDFCQPTEAGKNPRCSFHTLTKISMELDFFPSETLANITQQNLEIFGGHSLAECIDKPRKHRHVRF
jgi:hypothetical protein